MTDTEKKVMLRLCAKVIQYADFESDLEAKQLVNWVLLDGERKQNNNEIREIMAEFEQLVPDQIKRVPEALKRGNEICARRNELYESQREVKYK